MEKITKQTNDLPRIDGALSIVIVRVIECRTPAGEAENCSIEDDPLKRVTGIALVKQTNSGGTEK